MYCMIVLIQRKTTTIPGSTDLTFITGETFTLVKWESKC